MTGGGAREAGGGAGGVSGQISWLDSQTGGAAMTLPSWREMLDDAPNPHITIWVLVFVIVIVIVLDIFG